MQYAVKVTHMDMENDEFIISDKAIAFNICIACINSCMSSDGFLMDESQYKTLYAFNHFAIFKTFEIIILSALF